MRKSLLVCYGFLVVVLSAGCGTGHIQAKGKLLKNGEPFKPGENELVRLVFCPIADDNVANKGEKGTAGEEGSYMATFNREDSSFVVTGSNGKGLLPGKYRVSVELIKQRKDLFNGYYGSQSSPLVCEVVNGNEDLTLDLAATGKVPEPQQGGRHRN